MKATKLDSPLKYRHFAKVTVLPFSHFPIDMLRYDNCHPHEEVDASMIEDSFHMRVGAESRTILIEQYAETSMARWTVKRWESFGAKIEPIAREDIQKVRKETEKVLTNQ